jgi:hypothetical protein
LSDGVERQAFPQLEVGHDALVLGQLAKGTIQGLAKGGFVGMVRGFKKAGDVRLGVGTFVGAGGGGSGR